MSKNHIKENSFEGGVAGTNGTVNTQVGYGTFASPDVSQNPDQFIKHVSNEVVGSSSNTVKRIPKPGEINQDVNAIFADPTKAITVDDVISGIKQEEGEQLVKNRYEAKRTVVKNLRKNPRYYRDLEKFNTDGNMNESKHPNDAAARTKITPNIDETKKIFSEMAKANEKKYVVNSEICDVMKEMWAAKNARRLNK